MKRVLKKLAVAGLAVGVVAAGGIAYAMWSATSTGSGNAKALTAQTITVTAATGAADLYPGFAAGDVYFTLTNSNPYPVTFTSMTAGTVTSGAPSPCPSSNVTVANATGLSISVPANESVGVARSIADVVTMVGAAPDGCQGVTFTIGLTLTGSQV